MKRMIIGSACCLLLVGCGAGTDVTTAIQSKFAGAWLWDVTIFSAGAKQVTHHSPDGWMNFDSSGDGGATWCRAFSTWVVKTPVSEDDFGMLITHTAESTCKDVKAGDTMDKKLIKTADSPLTFKIASVQVGKDPSQWKWATMKKCETDHMKTNVCGTSTNMGAPSKTP